jgi:hypothetical protein
LRKDNKIQIVFSTKQLANFVSQTNVLQSNTQAEFLKARKATNEQAQNRKLIVSRQRLQLN